MQKIKVRIDGENKEINVEPDEILLDMLRRQGYYGVKRGCNEGTCGACAVIFNGRPVTSCMLLAVEADGGEITTIEGIGTLQKPHPLQTSFVEAGAVQCGFCTPGMIISAKSLLDKKPNPTLEDIKDALDGNLCRCTGYVKIVGAIQNAAQKIKEAK